MHIFVHIIVIVYFYYLIRAHLASPGYFQGEEINKSNFEVNIERGLVRENFCVTCLVCIYIY